MNLIIHHLMNYSQKNSCINYRENSVVFLQVKSELTLFTTTTFFLHGIPPNIEQLAFTHIKRLVSECFPLLFKAAEDQQIPFLLSVCLFIYRHLQECFAVYLYTIGFEPIVLNLYVAILQQFQPIKLSVLQSNPNLSAITPYAYCLFLYSVQIQLFIRIRWCHIVTGKQIGRAHV